MAHAFFMESASGRYPANFWKGIGQLVLAEMHCIMRYPDLFKKIEAVRLRMMIDNDYWPDLDPLINLATKHAKQENNELEQTRRRHEKR